MNLFLQLAFEKKDSKNSAARKYFGPSYFVAALVIGVSRDFFRLEIQTNQEFEISYSRNLEILKKVKTRNLIFYI